MSQKVIINGRIEVDKGQILGTGGRGTVVYRGSLGDRNVAVKRLLLVETKKMKRELDNLIKLDEHPYIIRYYHKEMDSDFCYIALELAFCTLESYAEGSYDGPKVDDTSILSQATEGLNWLHSKHIIHRDMKPSNILLVEAGGKVVAKLSDFGISKDLSGSHQTATTSLGTLGWTAPEILKSKSPQHVQSSASDVFSLGCVYYNVLTKGEHPFGEPIARDFNISRFEYSLSALKDVTARSLVEDMIQHRPERRPKAAAVLGHLFFWTITKTMLFIQAVSDHIPTDRKKRVDNRLSERLHVKSHLVLGGTAENPRSWKDVIDTRLDKGRCGKYGDDIVELLRLVRNKLHHFDDVPEAARDVVGNKPDDFMKYIRTKFPNLLFHVWLAASQEVRDAANFQKYFTDFKFSDGDTRELEPVLPEVRPPSQHLKTDKVSSGDRPNQPGPKEPPAGAAAEQVSAPSASQPPDADQRQPRSGGLDGFAAGLAAGMPMLEMASAFAGY